MAKSTNTTVVTDTTAIDETNTDTVSVEETPDTDTMSEIESTEDSAETPSTDEEVSDTGSDELSDTDEETVNTDEATSDTETTQDETIDTSVPENTLITTPEEPELENTPTAQEEVPAPQSLEEVLKFITDKANGTMRERLQSIATSGVMEARLLVSKLLTYNENMWSRVAAADKGAGYNYDLYNFLLDVMNTGNYNVFKIKMDIISIIFKEFANEGYAEQMLHRFDTEWEKRWGKQSLTTYQNMITVVAMLSDMSTRKKNMERISLDLALTKKDTFFSDTVIANLKKYYIG